MLIDIDTLLCKLDQARHTDQEESRWTVPHQELDIICFSSLVFFEYTHTIQALRCCVHIFGCFNASMRSDLLKVHRKGNSHIRNTIL